MPVYTRRRNLKTNYAKRLAMLKSGKSRIVLRLTNLYANIQYVEHNVKGDTIKFALLSKDLKEFGWTKGFKSIPACYLAGYLFGKTVISKKLKKDAILDLGLQNAFKQGKIFACVKGIIDSGLEIPVNEEAYPKEERIKGKHNKTEQLFTSVKNAIDAKAH
jgi:large subunit ribosomal protein L18